MEKMIIFSDRNLPQREHCFKIAQFLHQHLEQFGDSIEDTELAIDYALGRNNATGGFIVNHYTDDVLCGVVVVNKTGMRGYIPENILVYIAVHKNYRGIGIGKQLMQKAIELTDGGIALHVEADNPARYLYKKLGFVNKYLEMRLLK